MLGATDESHAMVTVRTRTRVTAVTRSNMAEDTRRVTRELRCRFCQLGSDSFGRILDHCVRNHEYESFSIRRLELQASTGKMIYRSIHFPVKIQDIKKKLEDGYTYDVNWQTNELQCSKAQKSFDKEHKDTNSLPENDHMEISNEPVEETTPSIQPKEEVDSNTKSILNEVLKVMEDMGRKEDFISVLQNIVDGNLDPSNITLQLMLDVGKFLSADKTNNVRYNQLTKDFWCMVKTLFHGKATNFFRGHMADGNMDGSVPTSACKINLAVPSDKTLSRNTQQHRIGAETPGILKRSLDAFAKAQPNADVKLSLDGKKLAYGFGTTLGDEDLGGHEEPPTLSERKQRLQKELSVLDTLVDKFTQFQVEQRAVCEIPENEIANLRSGMMDALQIMSQRVRELKTVVVKKKYALNLVMRKVVGDWKSSPHAPNISFLQTKIIECQACIDALYQAIDEVGYLIAYMNGTQGQYIKGVNTNVYLANQGNYVCLQKVSETDYINVCKEGDFHKVKQHTSCWHDLRAGACLTGSTWYNALGLRSAKEMKVHQEQVFGGKKPVVSEELQALFDYGSQNEINGVATIVGKLIPVYYPHLIFREDGCEKLPLQCTETDKEMYAIVSGDGSGVDKDNHTKVVFEIKCPKPGKPFTTDTFYQLPDYYTIQVLSQMATKECDSFINVCYTPTGTSFIEGKFDNKLWEKVTTISHEFYSGSTKKRKAHPQVPDLKEALKEYARKSVFLVEFPSLTGIACGCELTEDSAKPFKSHNGVSSSCSKPSSENAASICRKASETCQTAYNLLRIPAKEVLVSLVSDLDRKHQGLDIPYAAPIAYHMPGFSLKMAAVRGIIADLMDACIERCLSVKALAFDGQFLEICIKDKDGKPLTLCQLQKQIWQKATKMKKPALLEALHSINKKPSIETEADFTENFQLNHLAIGYEVFSRERVVSVFSQPNIVQSPLGKTHKEKDSNNDPQGSDAQILAELDQSELQEQLHNVAWDRGTQDMEVLHTDGPAKAPEDQLIAEPWLKYEGALCALIAGKSGDKFTTTSLEKFVGMLANTEAICQNFTVVELKTVLSTVGIELKAAKKMILVHEVCRAFGDGIEGKSVNSRKSSPKTLKTLVTNHLKTQWTCHDLAILYCNNVVLDAIQEWNDSSLYPPKCDVQFEDTVVQHIPQWYAQPSMYDGNPVQPIIDPHHLFVNNRCKVCAHGIPGMGISKEAWLKVAQNEKHNKTGLSCELVIELRDRQRNAFAQTTFSEAVENEMQKLGYIREANWCRLIRNWYQAVDEAGIPVVDRLAKLFEMRDFLLSFYNPTIFPPPGSNVQGLPIAQFEGILSNIDRRIQLYSMVSRGAYNQRAISSLDSETFFSGFQDIDPKGTGVLRPDDIPTAMANATFIIEQKLNENRGYYMKTARSHVYKHEPTLPSTPHAFLSEESHHDEMNATKKITVRNHHFDTEDRKRTSLKRKSGTIAPVQATSRGASGVRAFHKMNEEKILGHRRAGISDDELTKLLPL